MVVKNMNWDSMDSLTDFMIDDRDCDIAIIASIFWACEPGWHVANEERSSDTRIARIVANVDRGFYRRSELALNRFEVLHNVHAYSDAVRARRFTQQPPRITLPRVLLGPFVGREPAMAAATRQPKGTWTRLSTGSAARTCIGHRPRGATPTKATTGSAITSPCRR